MNEKKKTAITAYYAYLYSYIAYQAINSLIEPHVFDEAIKRKVIREADKLFGEIRFSVNNYFILFRTITGQTVDSDITLFTLLWDELKISKETFLYTITINPANTLSAIRLYRDENFSEIVKAAHRQGSYIGSSIAENVCRILEKACREYAPGTLTKNCPWSEIAPSDLIVPREIKSLKYKPSIKTYTVDKIQYRSLKITIEPVF